MRAACEQSDWCSAAFRKPVDAAEGSDLVVVCTPVDHILPLLTQLEPFASAHALFTDVGSTKSRICRGVSGGRLAKQFVGAHPMAGSEKSGMEHADPDLFVDRPCLITPTDSTDPEAIEKVIAFWNALGMRVSTLSPEKHDEIIAHLSHLPHLLASALAAQLSAKPDAWKALSGQGLRDTTRIASGSPELWSAIFQENREELQRALDDFDTLIGRFKSALHNEDWHSLSHLLSKGKSFRDGL